jgi:hypothetical protein
MATMAGGGRNLATQRIRNSATTAATRAAEKGGKGMVVIQLISSAQHGRAYLIAEMMIEMAMARVL